MSAFLEKVKVEGHGHGHEQEPEPEPEGEEHHDDDDSGSNCQEQEEALVALLEHRNKEVNNLRTRVTYYNSKLVEAEQMLHGAKRKLARLRNKDKAVVSSEASPENATRGPAESEGRRTSSPNDNSNLHRVPPGGPKLSKPSPKKIPQSSRNAVSVGTTSSGAGPSVSHSKAAVAVKEERSSGRSSDNGATRVQDKGTKRKHEPKEHKDLIPLICSTSSPSIIRCHTRNQFSSQHKRKLRSISLNPSNDTLFATSALDGVVNFWQIQAKGSSASLLSSTSCLSDLQRKWPEDLAWHPHGNSIFCAYSADGGDSQISILNLNKGGKDRVTFLEKKPHVRGIINNIIFVPWAEDCFVTGGSDHAVIMWNENENGVESSSWKPTALHRSMHSSAVMGVAGMQQKNVVLSAGADKRIFGYDVKAGRSSYKHQVESKCMSILPNPCDFNLFMVQTGQHERQLRLFDFRERPKEVHAFGWKQESSDSQSALIDQAWSPDGILISSGSVDPVIHIFDVRYNARKPSQSIRAHEKRVFKAVWHQNLPLLISISSDLNIGMHKII